MKRLLIVEDEKMIRQGIKAIAGRAPIEIEEILECKNGEEAYSVLTTQEIDVLITDIRMPKMDGITLIKKIQDLPLQPKILVISGYDDFNYAVEVLRYGVREYLLKPIEREKLTSILVMLNEEIEKEENLKVLNKQIENQQIKYLILNEEISEEEIKTIEDKFGNKFEADNFVVCCTHGTREELALDGINCIILGNMEGHTAIIMSERDAAIKEHASEERYVGLSNPYNQIKDLPAAFFEAAAARREGFVRNIPYHKFSIANRDYEQIPAEFAEQFVQLFGTAKADTVLSKLQSYIFRAKMNKIDAQQIMCLFEQILDKLTVTYKYIIELDMEGLLKLKQPYHYKNIQDYIEVFEEWLHRMKKHMLLEFEDYKNKEKINMAIQFIRENYAKDLNMAVVSNRLSMNYSLFSLNFKQYTGMNFVNYLKKIRIDEAKKMLEETDDKIIDISQKVGYDNEKHFMKTFKNLYGVSPSEYRRNMRIGKLCNNSSADDNNG